MQTRQHRKLLSAALLATCLSALPACTTVETQSFRVSKNSTVDSAKIATNADFSQYDRLLIDDMGIFFPKSAAVPAGDLERIRNIFREAFTAELSAYRITREPGPGMLQVQASLVDLRRATFGELNDFRGDLGALAAPGELIFLMEMRDSGTGEVLARASDSAATPQFADGGDNATNWSSVETAAKRWAELFRQFLDSNFGKK